MKLNKICTALLLGALLTTPYAFSQESRKPKTFVNVTTNSNFGLMITTEIH